MCFSTYQGCIKNKLNIQTHKSTLGYTWHQTDLEGCETGNSARLQGTMRCPFSKGGPVEACSAVTELLPLPLSTALEKAQAQGGEIHTGQVIHKSQYLLQKPHIVLPLGALQGNCQSHYIQGSSKIQLLIRYLQVFLVQMQFTSQKSLFIVLPYNIVNTTFTWFPGKQS